MNKITILKRLLKPILLIIISIIFFYYKYYIGLSVVIFAVYLLDNFNQLNECLKEKNQTDKFLCKLNNAIEDNVLTFIYPLALIRENGELIWSNNMFNSLRNESDNLKYYTWIRFTMDYKT